MSSEVFKFFILLGLLKTIVFGQAAGNLRVILRDPNGGLVNLAVVSVKDEKGGLISKNEISGATGPLSIDLTVGKYVLEIESPGFKIYQKKIEVKKSGAVIDVQLELEDLNLEVEVSDDSREKRLREMFSSLLSAAEIAALPESGEEIREELKRRYGDDILIQIDGDLDGSHIPSQDQIASIKVIRNAFDAEFHEIARIIVDIRTKGNRSKFGGFVNLSLNTSNLNARNPFHFRRLPENRRNFVMSVSGPVGMKNTSFNFSTFGTFRRITQNFIGTGFNLGATAPQKIGQNLVFSTFSLKHDLPNKHLLDLKYQNSSIKFTNFGLGTLDLPERGATRRNSRHKFTISESGTFQNKFVNEFRFELIAETETLLPKNDEVTVIISGAYNKGGLGLKNLSRKYGFRVADNLIFDAGNHSLKLGVDLEYENLKTVSENDVHGTFVFANLDEFQNRRPRQYSQTLGVSEYSASQLKTSFYFQDYTQLRRNAQISFGLRYEWQSDLKDYNNFSPRVGYVWSPEKSGKLIFRGGIGVFYDWLNTSLLSAVFSNDTRRGQKLIIINPGFPNPYEVGSTSRLLPPSISKLADNLKTPYILVTQNAVNYKFGDGLTLEGIYTFRKGLRHFRSRDVNAPLDGVRPNPGFGLIQLLESSGVSMENSLEIKANSYFKGINLFANYKLSRSISDYSSPLRLPMNSYDTGSDKSVADLDQTHKLNVGLTFELLKNLNVSPNFVFESGFPYTITTGADDNADTNFNDRPFGVRRNSKRAEFIKQIDLRLRWKVSQKYFGLKSEKDKSVTLTLNVRNLLNTANLTNYIGVRISPFFKKPTFAQSPRSIDLGVSYSF